MATLAPPSSQKAGDRPISFLLDNQVGSAPQAFVDLVIRPEELTRTDTSRMSVQQTMGGAWIDSFGAGPPTIIISGHTGWRRTAANSDDGLERFKKLKENVFDQWHAMRQTNIEAGQDPDQVRLIFSDALDDMSVVVAPNSFVLRRSKSRPLLAQFQISMTVVDTALQNQPYPAQFGFNGAAVPGLSQLSGLSSLTASVNSITSAINGAKAWVQASILGPVQGFMHQSAQLFGAVRGAITSATQLVGSVISVARDVAQTGVNLFRTLAAVASIPQLAKASLMAVAGAFSNILCVLKNALSEKLYVQDYSSLYGASNCSSTSGGRPASVLAGVNPFYQVVPTGGPSPFAVTQAAASAMRTMASSDPALNPMTSTALASGLSAINQGLSFL